MKEDRIILAQAGPIVYFALCLFASDYVSVSGICP